LLLVCEHFPIIVIISDRSLKEAAELNGDTRGPQITIVLDDIRSAHNVGNIIRAAEASKCDNVILCGSMTPSPPHPKVLKTSLGAAEYVPYQSSISTLEAIRRLKEDNYKVFGIETTSKSSSLWKVAFFEDTIGASKESDKIALVFGNELVGIDVQVLKECNKLVSVPTHGIKNSLNVATCASIIIWEALRQWECIQSEQ
jgi:tRNA G18 (ribose-2'-O)-methylase SpoU